MTLKITAWNCQMAFRKKAIHIQNLSPDILVVPECEELDRLKFPEEFEMPRNRLWCGDNPHKGLGVFSFGGHELELLTHNPEFKHVLPIKVYGAFPFTLMAVWANNPRDPDGQYATQVFKALDYYRDLMKDTPVVLAGDFNSNIQFDKPNHPANHKALVDRLANMDISSCYHEYHRKPHGGEKTPTFFLYRHEDKPYHLDYIFASNSMQNSLKKVTIGEYEEYRRKSDHVPISAEFEF